MQDFQGALYRFEHGGGARVVRYALALLAFCTLAAFYDAHFYKNFHTEEAMDSAQLAANISQGKGFTTLYIRPFSLYLLAKDGRGEKSLGSAHPDIANAPVYPFLVAGLMNSLPMRSDIPSTRRENFTVYQPEIFITLFNQLLYLAAVVALFQTARKWFDEPTAWISASAFAGSEIYWKFSLSGISTLLLVLLFIGLVRLMASLDVEFRSELPNNARLARIAAGLGAIAALACLVRYSLGWIMAPILVFIVVFGGKFRWRSILVVSVVFLAVTAPWLWRNYALCGNFFGLAAYAPYELTRSFPGDSLIRSTSPGEGLGALGLFDFARKIIANGHEIIASKLPTLGANWFFTVFLAGLLLPFNNAGLSRLRYFLLMLLPVFIVAEALGKTHVSVDSPEINSENLLVIFAPVTLVFAAHFLCTLVEQGLNQSLFLRAALVGCAAMGALPFLAGLLTPSAYPMAYPPYYPPRHPRRLKLDKTGRGGHDGHPLGHGLVRSSQGNWTCPGFQGGVQTHQFGVQGLACCFSLRKTAQRGLSRSRRHEWKLGQAGRHYLHRGKALERLSFSGRFAGLASG